MFYGYYDYSADAKGRVSIPSKFREELGECFYITKGLDKSLFVFPVSEWEQYAKSLTTGSITSPSNRAFSRIFLAGTVEVNMDKQGRVLIPQHLREYAGIEKEMVVIGVGSRVEMWSKEQWELYNSPDHLSYDELAENLENLGI